MVALQAPYRSELTQRGLFIVLTLAPVLFEALPESVKWDGREFKKKKEFHVTLVHAPKPREELLSLFRQFTATYPIALESFTGELRQHFRDEESTILAPCTVSNLERFFQEMRSSLGLSLPLQPAHVTLYLSRSERGVLVDSEEQMTALPLVNLPELSQLVKSVPLPQEVY